MFEEKAVHPIDVLKAMFPDVSAVEIIAVLYACMGANIIL
jgi:hypothetical protein